MIEQSGNHVATKELDQKRAPKPTERALDERLHRLIGARRGKHRVKSKSGSTTGRSSAASSATSSSSAHIREEAEQAALIACAAALKKKQALELEEVQLKAKKEQLAIETAIAESSVKLKGFEEYDNTQDGMNSYVSRRLSKINMKKIVHPLIHQWEGKLNQFQPLWCKLQEHKTHREIN